MTGGAFGERATRFLAGRDVVIVTKPAGREELLRVVERLAAATQPVAVSAEGGAGPRVA